MSQSLESLVATMTVAELANRAGITVEHLVEAAFGGRASSSSSSSSTPKSTKAPKAASNGEVARGGLSIDGVLAALRSVGAAAKLEDVRAKTGGTVQQVRAALQKLAGSKKVKITGQRRGTRYSAN